MTITYTSLCHINPPKKRKLKKTNQLLRFFDVSLSYVLPHSCLSVFLAFLSSSRFHFFHSFSLLIQFQVRLQYTSVFYVKDLFLNVKRRKLLVYMWFRKMSRLVLIGFCGFLFEGGDEFSWLPNSCLDVFFVRLDFVLVFASEMKGKSDFYLV